MQKRPSLIEGRRSERKSMVKILYFVNNIFRLSTLFSIEITPSNNPSGACSAESHPGRKNILL